MGFDLAFVTKVFAALFAIMNPIANVPVFLSLTEGASAQAQRRVAVLAAIGTATGCLIAVLAGRPILDLFGIDVDHFRLAGGLLVLLIALSMLQGTASHAHAATPHETAEDLDPASVALYPLTVPLLVGPGTIATLIVFAQTARAQGRIAELAAGLGAFLALLTAALLSAPFVGRHLTPNATAITRRLMGMILAAVAMEMMVASLQALFPGLAR
ncbi:multiple antibiotic resistance protein [Methylobacterium sp. BE186]|uniref:MarC family protein n=1 Tax=Methylobacterium sp. BE186 TaxID=2817715 RepID=UPI00285DDCFB|nr:MarC family protein [Methylobacterium sp. BE186]MDR7035886.1 multiple antibiotic resistance protein [Methylobacterium sp. BE186]